MPRELNQPLCGLMPKISVTHFKVLSAFIIWVTTLIGSVLPMCIRATSWTSRAESLAGGVFLGAGLAHLLADSEEELAAYTYPIGPAITISMFFLLTIVELFSYSEHDATASISAQNCHNKPAPSFFGRYADHSISELTTEETSSSQITPLVTTPLLEEENHSLFGNTNKMMTIATISLYIIMDVHSTIEGVALGILSNWSSVIAIFCAIVGHKPVEAFALSLIILKDKPTKVLFWILVVLYTLLSPVGVIAAIYIGNISSLLVKGIIAAISAGTFLFVGCHEWGEMFSHKNEYNLKEKIWHLSMFGVGILWMLLIAIIESETAEK